MSLGTIVCVDDRRDVLAALMRDLGDFAEEYQLLPCESASEAREAINEGLELGDTPRLLITDHRMPGGSGLQLMENLDCDSRCRCVPKLLLTGDPSPRTQAGESPLIRHGEQRYGVLPKPWKRRQLLDTVRALLA